MKVSWKLRLEFTVCVIVSGDISFKNHANLTYIVAQVLEIPVTSFKVIGCKKKKKKRKYKQTENIFIQILFILILSKYVDYL